MSLEYNEPVVLSIKAAPHLLLMNFFETFHFICSYVSQYLLNMSSFVARKLSINYSRLGGESAHWIERPVNESSQEASQLLKP